MELERREDEIIINNGQICFNVKARVANNVEKIAQLAQSGLIIKYKIYIYVIGFSFVVSDDYQSEAEANADSMRILEECLKKDWELDKGEDKRVY